MADNTQFQPIFDYIDQNNQKLIGLFEARLSQNNDELYERFENGFATKSDFNRMANVLDGLVKMVHKLDEERLLSVEWMRRVDLEVEKIKKHLQIV